MIFCKRYRVVMRDDHAEALCGALKARRDGECVECERKVQAEGLYEENVMAKKMVFHKTCEKHGAFEASGGRAKCPKCKTSDTETGRQGDKVNITDESDGRVLRALVEAGFVQQRVVEALRALVQVKA